MNIKFSQPLISILFWLVATISLAISTSYSPNASAYGYLATSEALTKALRSSQYLEDQKYVLYKNLIILLPLIQLQISHLEKTGGYTKEQLESILHRLFTQLFLLISQGSPCDHAIIAINVFFGPFGVAPHETTIKNLFLFIIRTTSTRFFRYVSMMMHGELSPLFSNQAVFYHEQLLMRNYPHGVASAIIHSLQKQFIQNQQQLIEQLDFSSVRNTAMICHSILLLGTMIEHFSGNKELVFNLKQRFNKAVFDHHAHRHQGNLVVLTNLIRLTLSLYIPSFTRKSTLASPGDHPAVLQFLSTYVMYLRKVPGWSDTFYQPLSFDLAITASEQHFSFSEASHPEESSGTPETTEEAGSHFAFQLAITSFPGSQSTMASEGVITEYNDSPMLEDTDTATEDVTPKEETPASVEDKDSAIEEPKDKITPSTEDTSTATEDIESKEKTTASAEGKGTATGNAEVDDKRKASPEPVVQQKPDTTNTKSAKALPKTDKPKNHPHKNAAQKRKKQKAKKEAQKQQETPKFDMPEEHPDPPNPADEEIKTSSSTVLTIPTEKKEPEPEQKLISDDLQATVAATDVKKDHDEPPEQKTKKKKKWQPPRNKKASQKQPDTTSAATPFDTDQNQTPAASQPEKSDSKNSRKKNDKKQKKASGTSDASTKPSHNDIEPIKLTVSDESTPDKPGEAFPKDKNKSEKPAKPPQLEIPDLSPRALKFLNYLLSAIYQHPNTMILTGSNAGQLILRDLYGHEPVFGLIWDFTTSDTAFVERFIKLFGLLSPPFTYVKQMTDIHHQTITLLEQEEGKPDRKLISFRFQIARTVSTGNESHLPPFDRLNIHSAGQQLDTLLTSFEESDAPPAQDLKFLKQWRLLEGEKPKLAKKSNRKLFALGRKITVPYDRDPVIDEQMRQALPRIRPEDNCEINDILSLPEKLICQCCKQPKYHAIQAECGNIICHQCVERAVRDISGRLICPDNTCGAAHYPSEFFRDGSVIKELRKHAIPETALPTPIFDTYVKDVLKNTETWQSRHSSIFPFQLLQDMLPEGEPDEAACTASATALSEFSATNKGATPSLDRLLKYHKALIVYATCHRSLQIPASKNEELTPDIKRRTLTRDIINHSHDLVQEGLASLEADIDKPKTVINIAIIILDVALIHSQNLQYLQSLCTDKKLPSKLKLLKDIPSGFYPPLMKKVRQWITGNRHTLIDEPLFMLQRFRQLLPHAFNENNRSTFFGEASTITITEAFLAHLYLSLIDASLEDQYQNWSLFLTYLVPIIPDLQIDIENNAQEAIQLLTLLAEQISILLVDISHRTHYSYSNEALLTNNIELLLQQLTDDIIPLFTETRSRIIDPNELPQDLHSFIQNPDNLKQVITESHQLMEENARQTELFRTEQLKLWSAQRQLLLEEDERESIALAEAKAIAKKADTKIDYSLVWKGYSEFEEHQKLLNDAAMLAHSLQFMGQQLPVSGLEQPYQPLDINQFLETLDQLSLQAFSLLHPEPSLIQYYHLTLHSIIVNSNLQVMLDSLEHVEMMEANLKYFRSRMDVIRRGLESSYQTFARWERMRAHSAPHIYDRKAAAQLIDNIHELRDVMREILNKTDMTSAWLERWHRGFDDLTLPLPEDTTRLIRQKTGHLINNLPPGYQLHWVTPNGNCLYEAILMGLNPTHQPPSHQQMVKLRKKLHRLLKKIIAAIKKAPESQHTLLWDQFSNLMGLSMDAIQALVNEETILTAVSGEMTPDGALSLFGDIGFVAPLAILQLGTPISTMSVSSPAYPETWYQQHMNVFSTWLHHAPQLLATLVNSDTMTLDHFEHGDQLALALISQDPAHISELVTQHTPTQTPFAIVHTGSSEDFTGHFFLATYTPPADTPQLFSLETLEGIKEMTMPSAAMMTILSSIIISTKSQ